jgi:hypothetical protein
MLNCKCRRPPRAGAPKSEPLHDAGRALVLCSNGGPGHALRRPAASHAAEPAAAAAARPRGHAPRRRRLRIPRGGPLAAAPAARRAGGDDGARAAGGRVRRVARGATRRDPGLSGGRGARRVQGRRARAAAGADLGLPDQGPVEALRVLVAAEPPARRGALRARVRRAAAGDGGAVLGPRLLQLRGVQGVHGAQGRRAAQVRIAGRPRGERLRRRRGRAQGHVPLPGPHQRARGRHAASRGGDNFRELFTGETTNNRHRRAW